MGLCFVVLISRLPFSRGGLCEDFGAREEGFCLLEACVYGDVVGLVAL